MRGKGWSRELVCEHHLCISDLIWPVFVIEGENREQAVASMPGVSRLSIDLLLQRAARLAEKGLCAVAIFPYVEEEKKTPNCEEAWNEDNLVCRATRALKQELPDLGVMLDIALDPYNAYGHDGLVDDGIILNDETIECLVKQSLAQARAGADILGPSDMMDGRIGAIRDALESEGHQQVLIMSYAAKFASALYGPFRDAVGSSGALKGDKKTYQLDCGNSREALRQAARDVAEGADMLLVKPGLPYLDICAQLRQRFELPVFAYQVSGEYAMIRAAAASGCIDADAVMMESLLAFKRAGCDGIITYYAPEAIASLASEA